MNKPRISFLLNLFKKYRNILLYGFIGAFSILIDIGVFKFLVQYFKIDYFIANIISIHCGILNSFLLNFYFNFQSKNKKIHRLIYFYIVGLIGLLLSSLLLHLLKNCLYFHIITSKYITIVFVSLLQFLINSKFTFKK